MKDRKIQKNSGIVLVLSVLIIAASLAVTFTFSGVIISHIQQSRLIDQSIQAHYLAESGAERALYQMRKREAVPICSEVTAGSNCEPSTGTCTGSGVPCISSTNGNIDILSGWNVTVQHQRSLQVYMKRGDSVQIDLFNPYISDPYISEVRSFLVKSRFEPAAQLYGEITNLSWIIGGVSACPAPNTIPEQPAITKGPILLSSQPGGLPSQTGYLTGIPNQSEFLPNCSYVMRLSNLEDNSDGVYEITLYREAQDVGPEDLVEIPSRLIINASAQYGSSKQFVTVTAPMRPPLSGLYDYVIFSEEQISKVNL